MIGTKKRSQGDSFLRTNGIWRKANVKLDELGGGSRAYAKNNRAVGMIPTTKMFYNMLINRLEQHSRHPNSCDIIRIYSTNVM